MKLKLNQLLSFTKLSNVHPDISVGGWFREYYFESLDNVFFVYVSNRKSAIEFDNLIDSLWKAEKDIENNFCKLTFRNHIMDLILRKLKSNTEFDDKDWSNILKLFQKVPVTKYEIFKELKGCSIKSKQPITLNQFTIYDWPKHYKFIKEKYPRAFEKQYPSFYDESKPGTLVSIILKTKDNYRAHEMADNEFKRLENVLRYLFTESTYVNHGSKLHDIGIFDFRKSEWLETIDITETSKGGITQPVGTYKDLELTTKSFSNKKHIRKIWEILEMNPTNKLHIRILNAIEWIGKAKHEIEMEKAFLLYFLSIESLLNFNESGLIAPSLTQQMKEYTAFILGKTKKDRIEIDKLFSQLYAIRSAIVHGSTKEITTYNIEDVENLAQKLVIEFLVNPKLINLKSQNSFEELKNYVREMRYTSR